MEHPILFISIILEKLGLPVPHGPVGHGFLEQLCAPYMTYTWLVMAFLFFVSKLTLSNLEMVPGKGQNFWELVIGGMDDFFVDNMGRKLTDQFFPMLATFALYIAVANLIGLIPGFMSPTSSINTTLALTIIVWLTHHFIGFREHGLSYYKHFMGPMWWLVPLMLPIELISNLGQAAVTFHSSFRKYHGKGNAARYPVYAGRRFFCSAADHDTRCPGLAGAGDGFCPAGGRLFRSGPGTCTLNPAGSGSCWYSVF